jgi:hypothetical protein
VWSLACTVVVMALTRAELRRRGSFRSVASMASDELLALVRECAQRAEGACAGLGAALRDFLVGALKFDARERLDASGAVILLAHCDRIATAAGAETHL